MMRGWGEVRLVVEGENEGRLFISSLHTPAASPANNEPNAMRQLSPACLPEQKHVGFAAIAGGTYLG